MRARTRRFNKIEQLIISVPRWVLRVFLLAVIGFLVISVVGYCSNKEVIKYPSPEEAPWAIQTYIEVTAADGTQQLIASRLYFAKQYMAKDGNIFLNGYWENNGRGYDYYEGIKDLSSYKKVDLVLRK